MRERVSATAGTLPETSRGILSDLRSYFLSKPAIPTLVEFASATEREHYSQRIMQRLGIQMDRYSVLNMHRVGIDAPVRYVFEELFSEDLESRCWPGHVAFQHRAPEGVDEIRVIGLGGMRRLHAWARALFGENFGTLFRMSLLSAQHRPNPSNFDNARYLLYECGGGYPVGVLGIYVRSPVADQGERESSQVFFVVGFNFYGKRDWPKLRLVNRLWEGVHNRVTANVLNRFKQICEHRFEAFRQSYNMTDTASGSLAATDSMR